MNFLQKAEQTTANLHMYIAKSHIWLIGSVVTAILDDVITCFTCIQSTVWVYGSKHASSSLGDRSGTQGSDARD